MSIQFYRIMRFVGLLAGVAFILLTVIRNRFPMSIGNEAMIFFSGAAFGVSITALTIRVLRPDNIK